MSSRQVTRWGPTVAVALAILVGSTLPVPGQSPGVVVFGVGADKVVHALSYAVLTGLLAVAWGHRSPWALVAAGVVAVGYGGGIELVQSAVPTRTFSLPDVVANAVGVGLAVVLTWWRLRERGR